MFKGKVGDRYGNIIHHNLVRTQLLESKALTVLVKQPYYIQTKMYRLYRKMTMNGHFSI